MKCQNLFFGKKKKIFSMSSAENFTLHLSIIDVLVFVSHNSSYILCLFLL